MLDGIQDLPERTVVESTDSRLGSMDAKTSEEFDHEILREYTGIRCGMLADDAWSDMAREKADMTSVEDIKNELSALGSQEEKLERYKTSVLNGEPLDGSHLLEVQCKKFIWEDDVVRRTFLSMALYEAEKEDGY